MELPLLLPLPIIFSILAVMLPNQLVSLLRTIDPAACHAESIGMKYVRRALYFLKPDGTTKKKLCSNSPRKGGVDANNSVFYKKNVV
jgi:hypothetical protein